MSGCERYVVSHYRLGETLQGNRAALLQSDPAAEPGGDALGEQDLPILGLGAKPRCDVAHRADRGVARALGEPDLT